MKGTVTPGTGAVWEGKTFDPVQGPALLELIEINDAATAQGSYSKPATLLLDADKGQSGEIDGATMIMTQDGSGAIIAEDGTLLVFSSLPTVVSGATDLPKADRRNIIGQIQFLAADWDSDTLGASAYSKDPIIFKELNRLFFVWHHLGATTINSAGGDDERLQAAIHFLRIS